MSDLARQVIDAMTTSSTEPGQRALHAKGVLCAATFTPTTEAAGLSRAPHLSGEPTRAHVRFSNASGNRHGADAAPREGRGMAVKLYLAEGQTTDIVSVDLPAFFVATPEAFVELVDARAPDPATGEPDPARVGAFVEAHPESLTALGAVLASQPPLSYASVAYNALHTYGFVDAAGRLRHGRYRWRPEVGMAHHDPEEAAGLGHDYLQGELKDRLARGPFSFALEVELAAPGDALEDPSVAWPDDREKVTIGHLLVTALADDREHDGDVLVFDPVRITDGLELSDDAILRFRPHAYAESVRRRTGA